MKWVPWLGAVLLVAGLGAGVLSGVALSRASETRERIDSSLQRASELISEAETVKETDPAKYEELLAEARRSTNFAELDQQEYFTQSDGGWYLAGGAGAGVIGGTVLLAVYRFRIVPRQRMAQWQAPQQPGMWPPAV
ncbi:hypothetical protein FHS43_000635 [Streptosporangium becharense]|uniref:Uncharacterized protein n=1 Tax=Streptosporangium becharense TaxID=1816182 RepID=A0A7W9IGI2_9ACTN|nr:hypothetical protein [Streptosporangium becharense]MBB2909389.1 hypothetical protein [Streptosporangium becharense]MBB5819654.1 hypothetical protein [Streptosporangium becharense]